MKINPCSKCGGKAEGTSRGIDDYQVHCKKCNSGVRSYTFKSNAISAWNTQNPVMVPLDEVMKVLDAVDKVDFSHTCRDPSDTTCVACEAAVLISKFRTKYSQEAK